MSYRKLSHCMTTLGKAGLHTVNEGKMLAMLAEHGCLRCAELARLMKVSTAAITGMADALERAGLMERKAIPEDRRVVLLVITAKGKRVVDSAWRKTGGAA
jgi:DNA-binding MarR family transcriptional regulator